jgi:hypothetical protein
MSIQPHAPSWPLRYLQIVELVSTNHTFETVKQCLLIFHFDSQRYKIVLCIDWYRTSFHASSHFQCCCVRLAFLDNGFTFSTSNGKGKTEASFDPRIDKTIIWWMLRIQTDPHSTCRNYFPMFMLFSKDRTRYFTRDCVFQHHKNEKRVQLPSSVSILDNVEHFKALHILHVELNLNTKEQNSGFSRSFHQSPFFHFLLLRSFSSSRMYRAVRRSTLS